MDSHREQNRCNRLIVCFRQSLRSAEHISNSLVQRLGFGTDGHAVSGFVLPIYAQSTFLQASATVGKLLI